MATKNWFEILVLCRELWPTAKFTAADLARAAHFEDIPERPKIDRITGMQGPLMTKGSKKEQIASAWLSKFVKWKYLEVSGKINSNGKRPANTYVLTTLGLNCVLREGQQKAQSGPSDLETAQETTIEKISDAIYYFAEKRGTKEEEAAFQTLIEITDALWASDTEEAGQGASQ